jgi:hypothetical protein
MKKTHKMPNGKIMAGAKHSSGAKHEKSESAAMKKKEKKSGKS